MENLLQVHSGHTLTPAVAAEFLSTPTVKASSLQSPRRAATYPGNLHCKRVKKAAPVRNMSPTPSLSSSATPAVINVLPTLFSESGAFTEVSDLCSLDARAIEQPSDSRSLSTINDSQEYRHEDFMPTLGNTWALDQCNDLYDLLDGEYSYVHDLPHPAKPFQVQELFMRPVGYGFSDSVQSLEDNTYGALEGLIKTGQPDQGHL